MTRYLIALGPPKALLRLRPALDARAEDGEALRIERPAPHCLVAIAPDTGCRIGRTLVLIGALHGFGAQASAAADAFAAADADGQGFDRLLACCWGGFALLRLGEEDDFALARDPSGAVPVYWTRQSAVTLFFSDIDVPLRFGLLDVELDAAGLAHQLRGQRLRTAPTAVKGVRELLPGCLHLRRNPTADPLWWDPARAVGGTSEDDAAARVEAAVDRAARGLFAGRQRVLLELSGGLDSSIVAAALARLDVEVHAASLVTAEAEGDERRYAGAVAGHLGIPRIYLAVEPGALLDADAQPRLRPGVDPVLRRLDALLRDHAGEVGADCFASGIGGDNVFCAINTAAPAVDLLLAGRPSRALGALRDVAARNGCTSWTAARFALRKLRRRRRSSNWGQEERCLGATARDVRLEAHPWLMRAAHCPPGQAEHIRMLVAIHDFLDAYPRARAAPILRPLFSQPVMEACLAIPSWRWVAGGRDRAVAREAFRARLPLMITQRRTKGRLEAHYLRSFELVRDRLRPLLLDGWLAANGLLDRAQVETALGSEIRRGDDIHYLLLSFAGVELWLQSLLAARARSARQRLY